MVFSSVPPVYRDPWHHHNLHQQPNLPQETISTGNAELPPYGGGRKSGSMTERAKVAKIPQPETALKCPRCESTNTKFCYFNNYNLSQPRHLCKTCRRYWTRGGVLRNVPVGGGCRRNKKSTNKKTSKPHGTGTHVKHSIIDSTTCSSTIAPHQLPLLSSLQNLGQFGGLNVTHDSILSADQWRSVHNNFPFLAGGFDQSSPAAAINSNLMFSFHNDIGVNEATPRSRVSGALKMEESPLGLRRSSATPFWGNNNQCYTNSWGGGEWLGNTAAGQQLHSSGGAGGGGGGGTTTHFL